MLDGFIARKFNFISSFGKLLDPLADKTTQIFTLIALSFVNIIPWWILVIVFIKEGLMIAGASYLYGKELVVSSRWYGKLSTFIFYIAIVSSFVIKYWNNKEINQLPQFDIYIYYLALAVTIFSLIMYYREFMIKGYLNREALRTKDKEMIPKLTKEEKVEKKENRKQKREIKKDNKKQNKIK